MIRPSWNLDCNKRRGVVLLAVLVVIVLLSLAAYQFSELMMAEQNAVSSYTKSVQTKALADSGINYVAALLSNPDELAGTLNYNPYDNPIFFQDIPVEGDAEDALGQFSIIAVKDPEQLIDGADPMRFGVSDETGKININAILGLDGGEGNVAYEILMRLPNMTQDIANSILDWLDPDETPRSGGAENETYSQEEPARYCKNGPLDSLEELLLVNGVTPELLFGNDRNRNGLLDPSEDDGSGGVTLGWAAFLTIYSRERNLKPDGTARLYINDRDLSSQITELTEMVGEEVAMFIAAYRLYGGQQINEETVVGDNADLDAIIEKVKSEASGRRRRRLRSIASVYDLVNAQVSVSIGDGRERRTVQFASPFLSNDVAREVLPILLDELTTTRDADLVPRINVNTCSRTVLMALPSLEESDVQAILENQPDYTSSNAPDEIYQTPTWLLTEANISPDKLRGLDRFLTARSQVYRFQVLGYFKATGQVARVEAVVDTNYGRPRIVYKRDLSGLGRGVNLDQQ